MSKKGNGGLFHSRFVFLDLHRKGGLLTETPVTIQQEPWSQPETVDCPLMPGSIYSSSRSEGSIPVERGFSKKISAGMTLDSAGVGLTAL